MRIGKVICTEEFLQSSNARILFSVFKKQSTKALDNGIFEITGTSPLFDDLVIDVPTYTAIFDGKGGVEFRHQELREWK